MDGADADGALEVAALLRAAEQAAWDEYLETTRFQAAFRYEELEPWAWRRLQTRLKAVEARLSAARG